MSKWFLLNFLLLITVIWKVTEHYSFPNLKVHILLGLLGVLLFLYNWTRNAVFETIRNIPDRKVKIRLAKLSKRVVMVHRWTGNIVMAVILLHGLMIISQYGFTIRSPKMVVGLMALVLMAIQVITGWVRLFKPTIRVRYIHLYNGMVIFFFVTLHILL
ncbi:hypothetical protein [Ornithinibacillus scapharcae]|uniref:hypothetical protein n=1 Tax=Ornithinibacillus scapharcae TaxID=1147159 RepID=UPI000225B6A5|nr:hypothetical protein [Ornithinibacillus scapharcae]